MNKKFVHELARISTNYLLVFFLLLLFSCKNIKTENSIFEPSITQHYELTLLAVGDNLFHETLINSHKQRDGTYNFDPIYTEIKDLVLGADLAFINQETVMGGTHLGYQGYPTFNSPQSLAIALKNAGFDIINIANNHTMDMGREGLYNTLDLLNDIKQFTVIGARKEGVNFRLVRENNITLGFLSYTYGLNGHPLPKDNPNAVSLINRTKITQDINDLRPLCDFLVVSMHWGTEYDLIEPDSLQKSLAVFLAQHNVDLIIGHHPHVLQRVESLPRPDGKQTLCFYSLGNFVSHQREKDRVLGGIMTVSFTKSGTELNISDYGLIPVVTHFEGGYTNTKVYPYYTYTEDLLKKHLLHIRDNTMSFEYYKNVLNKLNVKIIMHYPY